MWFLWYWKNIWAFNDIMVMVLDQWLGICHMHCLVTFEKLHNLCFSDSHRLMPTALLSWLYRNEMNFWALFNFFLPNSVMQLWMFLYWWLLSFSKCEQILCYFFFETHMSWRWKWSQTRFSLRLHADRERSSQCWWRRVVRIITVSLTGVYCIVPQSMQFQI